MRIDRNTGQHFNNFSDWLLTGWNIFWVLSLVIGYMYYLVTTEEA